MYDHEGTIARNRQVLSLLLFNDRLLQPIAVDRLALFSGYRRVPIPLTVLSISYPPWAPTAPCMFIVWISDLCYFLAEERIQEPCQHNCQTGAPIPVPGQAP